MANEYQQALIESIDYLINNRVNQLSLDKTVVATIKQCVDATANQYLLSYNGGSMYAYAQDGASYTESQTVYVLVPQGDFSQKKIIVGKASNVGEDGNINFISSALTDYNLVGSNVLTELVDFPIGLNTYRKEDYKLLYKRDPLGNNMVSDISLSKWQTPSSDSGKIDAISLGTEETGSLSGVRFTITKRSSSWCYAILKDSSLINDIASLAGKSITLTMRVRLSALPTSVSATNVSVMNGNATNSFCSFASLGSKIKTANEWVYYESTATVSSATSVNEQGLYINLYGYPEGTSIDICDISIVEGDTSVVENNMLSVDDDAFKNYISQSESIMIRARIQTRLPRSHRMSMTGTYGIQFVLAFKTQDTDGGSIKYASYILDNTRMDGNPFLYTTPSSQYVLFSIDSENFLYIDSIMAYSKDFVTQDDPIQIDAYGDDIFIDDVEIYGLKRLDAVNGDYRLKLSTPYGTIFKGGASPTSELQAIGRLTYQETTDLSDSATYYWFKEDPRVNSLSENYQMYGGSGWSYERDLGSDYIMTTTKSQNKAYENKYLCVCVYKQQIILKTYFSIFNDEAKRDVEIVSDLGVKFSFDRGKPILTCLVNGKSSHFEDTRPDSYYRFLWSKVDEFGQVITFDKTQEELEKEYQDGIGNLSYSALVALQNQITEMGGVTVDRNVFSYPVKGIMNIATFKCSIYLRDTADGDEYYAGYAQIILYNEGAVQPADYYILIENGNQVFQYSESGVSPASDRYIDPQEILPLYCHFYDPAGLEVDASTYSLKWKVPTELTMLVVPTELTVNPSNNIYEWFMSPTYPTAIADEFDYQALNNQVTAIVTYNGQEFQKDSDLTFLKVGDNGTNGTDVVCKIVPKNFNPTYDDEMFSVFEKNVLNPELIGTYTLDMEVYKSGILAQKTYTPTWKISGGSSYSYPLDVSNSGQILYKDSSKKPKNYLSNNVIVGQITEDGQTYYAYFPVCSIAENNSRYHFRFKKTKSLKQILYNSDGRYPLYNKNQGISYALYDASGNEIPTDRYSCYWSVVGGRFNNEDNSILNIEDENGNLVKYVEDYHGDFVKIVPNDVYTGEYCNNSVFGQITVDDSVVAYVDFAIYVGLNRYGLSSLNAWDGNHIEINEDSNYILAPQIGAGMKESDNSFTGVVMGTASTYDPDDEQEDTVGLLGYSKGKQSIFLDAKTGKAVFGLPEDQASQENRYAEGRIELVPGGESKIGNWTIGSRSLYNISTYEGTESPFSTTKVGDEIRVNYNADKDNPIFIHEPDDPYTNYPVPGAQFSIPHTAQGILLNSVPAYLSIKGMPLTSDNSDIDWNGANTTIKEGDSLEVEIDPRKSSLFSIFRHTRWQRDKDGKDYQEENFRRYPLVGINAYGQFYTNAIEDGDSSMGVGPIGAFKHNAGSRKYFGAQFGYSDTNLLKFYIDIDEQKSMRQRTLHFSTGTTVTTDAAKGDEYPRAMHFHARSFALYATSGDSDEQVTTDRLILGSTSAILGHEKAYISIPSNANTVLVTPEHGLDISAGKNSTLTLGANLTTTVSGSVTNTLKSTLTNTITGNTTTNIATGFYKLNVQNNSTGIALTSKYNGITSDLILDNNSAEIGTNNARLILNTASTSTLRADYGLNVTATNHPILIKNTGAANGIDITAAWSSSDTKGQARLFFKPAQDGHSTISATTGDGQFTLGKTFSSTQNGHTVSGSGIEITPGIYSKYMTLTGSENGANGGYTLLVSGVTDLRILTMEGPGSDKNIDVNLNAVWVKSGGILIEGKNVDNRSISASGDIYSGTNLGAPNLVIGNKGMNQGWFDAIQNLYNHWRSERYFPLDSSEIANMGFVTNSSLDGRGYVTSGALSSALSGYVTKGSGVNTLPTIGSDASLGSVISHVNNITNRVNSLISKLNNG